MRLFHRTRGVMPGDYSAIRAIDDACFCQGLFRSRRKMQPIERHALKRLCQAGGVGSVRMRVALSEQGHVCGFVLFDRVEPAAAQGVSVLHLPRHLLILKVAVAPDRRGEGVATDLIDKLLERTSLNVFREVVAMVPPAYPAFAALLRRMGFAKAGPAVLGGDVYTWQLRGEMPPAERLPGEHIDWRPS